jgi:sialate O-acetylesterase
MTMKTSGALLTALLLAPLAAIHAADLTFAGIFTDHTVLQRDVAAPVWGWANPNEQVTLAFAGQSKSATADPTGKWLVRLDPMSASTEGRELLVESTIANRKSRITDVVVGDVWLCSGQSNMHFQMSRVENSREEIAAADHPAVRFFTVGDQFGQGPMADAKGAWQPVTPTTAAGCSAVAYYFARDLQRKLGVPIGLMVSSVGGTRIETWMRPETLATIGEASPLIEKWKNMSPEEFENIATTYRAYQYQRDKVHPLAVKAAKAQGAPVPPEPTMPKLRCHDCPSALHNGMIAPLQPFAIRGAIWYQGESNSGQPAPYEKLLPAMIADWRRVWGEELPFLFVQLAPHRNTHPAFREAQHRIWQKTPHTAMVVTTDVGDANDIHPTRKRPVGERLALAALALSYGERLEYSGPVFKSMKVESDRAVISFTHTGEGLMAKGDLLKGFTMAGTDGKFIAATALIAGSTVVVTSDKITKPVAVRYGWAMVPDGNLFNREGLPAVPFRTDAPADRISAESDPRTIK